MGGCGKGTKFRGRTTQFYSVGFSPVVALWQQEFPLPVKHLIKCSTLRHSIWSVRLLRLYIVDLFLSQVDFCRYKADLLNPDWSESRLI
jgi:hypothetical protein